MSRQGVVVLQSVRVKAVALLGVCTGVFIFSHDPLVSLLITIPRHMSFITGPLINSLSSRFKYAKWDVRG